MTTYDRIHELESKAREECATNEELSELYALMDEPVPDDIGIILEKLYNS